MRRKQTRQRKSTKTNKKTKMPNVHSEFKRLFSVQLTQEVYRELEKRAEAFDMPVNTYIVTVLARDLANVKLTKENEKIILGRINEVINRRAAKCRLKRKLSKLGLTWSRL